MPEFNPEHHPLHLQRRAGDDPSRDGHFLARLWERRRRDAGPPPVPSPRTVFVLSGGGVLGAAQVGMLAELDAAGIRADAVVACSVGALNGCLYASNDDPADSVEALTALWLSLRPRDLFPSSTLGLVSNVLKQAQHLHAHDGLVRIIKHWAPERFDDLRIPLRVVAADIESGAEVVFAAGPLQPALLASTALPGVFPIVEHDGMRLVDGGTLNALPVNHADVPGSRIFVLNVSGSLRARELRGQLDVLRRAFAMSRAARVAMELDRVADRATVISVADPGVAPTEFTQTRELIEAGAAAARAVITSLPSPTATESQPA